MRHLLSAIEVFGMMAAIWLATEDRWIIGFALGMFLIVLAWTEGSEGWGSSTARN